MKIYFRPLLYLFEKNIGKFFSKNAGFLKKPNFYLIVFMYIIKFSNLTTYSICKGLINFIEAFECIHKIIECTV